MCIPRKGIGLPIRALDPCKKDLELLEFRRLTRARWIGTAIALPGIWLFTSLKFGQRGAWNATGLLLQVHSQMVELSKIALKCDRLSAIVSKQPPKRKRFTL